jgi:hypothetical protein
LLYYVLEQRRIVVGVVMMCLPRSATTKVKAQEFAGHACFEEPWEARREIGHARDRAGRRSPKEKSWGFGVACWLDWV